MYVKVGKSRFTCVFRQKKNRVMMHLVIGLKLELSGYFKSIFLLHL